MKRKIDYDNWSKDELVKEIKRIKETTYGLVWHRDLPEEKIDEYLNKLLERPLNFLLFQCQNYQHLEL